MIMKITVMDQQNFCYANQFLCDAQVPPFVRSGIVTIYS